MINLHEFKRLLQAILGSGGGGLTSFKNKDGNKNLLDSRDHMYVIEHIAA